MRKQYKWVRYGETPSPTKGCVSVRRPGLCVVTMVPAMIAVAKTGPFLLCISLAASWARPCITAAGTRTLEVATAVREVIFLSYM